MVIIRGISNDEQNQVGFYGTHQEVFQQLKEQEEGFSNSRRWISHKPQNIQTHCFETHKKCKKRNICPFLRCGKQISPSTQCFVRQTVLKE